MVLVQAWRANGRTVDDRDDSVVAKEKAAPAVRSLIDPFSLHASAAPLHHPPAPASFRSSLRGICSVPVRVAPSQAAQHSTYDGASTHEKTTHKQHSNSGATPQHVGDECHRLRLRPRRGANKVLMGPSHSSHFCRSCNLTRTLKLDKVTFWNVSEHLRTEHRIDAPQHGSSCQYGTSTQSISARLQLRACLSCCCLQPSPASRLTPSVFSVPLGS